MSRAILSLILSILLNTACGVAFSAVDAKVVAQAKESLFENSSTPVYVWGDPHSRPRALILAIHGLTMHGKVFEHTAKHLAAQRCLVAAPDLRGYGSWYQNDPHCKTKYQVVEADLTSVAQTLRKAYPGVPLFVAGESLGGTAALRLAAQHPELVDGLILSAPALRYHNHVGVRTMAQIAMLAMNPTRRIDVSKYVAYFSDDAKIQQEWLADPLLRKRMGLGELLASCHFMSHTATYLEEIPSDMPVLIMQGKKDQMVKATSVALLEEKLKSQKRTVCWFPQRGHILLETAHVEKETLDVMSKWLKENCATMRTAHTTAMSW